MSRYDVRVPVAFIFVFLMGLAYVAEWQDALDWQMKHTIEKKPTTTFMVHMMPVDYQTWSHKDHPAVLYIPEPRSSNENSSAIQQSIDGANPQGYTVSTIHRTKLSLDFPNWQLQVLDTSGNPLPVNTEDSICLDLGRYCRILFLHFQSEGGDAYPSFLVPENVPSKSHPMRWNVDFVDASWLIKWVYSYKTSFNENGSFDNDADTENPRRVIDPLNSTGGRLTLWIGAQTKQMINVTSINDISHAASDGRSVQWLKSEDYAASSYVRWTAQAPEPPPVQTLPYPKTLMELYPSEVAFQSKGNFSLIPRVVLLELPVLLGRSEVLNASVTTTEISTSNVSNSPSSANVTEFHTHTEHEWIRYLNETFSTKRMQQLLGYENYGTNSSDDSTDSTHFLVVYTGQSPLQHWTNQQSYVRMCGTVIETIQQKLLPWPAPTLPCTNRTTIVWMGSPASPQWSYHQARQWYSLEYQIMRKLRVPFIPWFRLSHALLQQQKVQPERNVWFEGREPIESWPLSYSSRQTLERIIQLYLPNATFLESPRVDTDD